MVLCLFTGSAPALFDAWFVIDNFVKEAASSLPAMKESAKKSTIKMYLQEYYNVSTGYPLTTVTAKFAAMHIVNSVVELLNEKPHFLVVMPDKDVIKDIDYSSEEAPKLVQVLVSWMVRQIDMLI